MANFKTIITNAGLQIEEDAHASGAKIDLTQMAVGDGMGNPIVPDPAQVALARELFRAPINQLSGDQSNPGRFTAELVIPATVGGFTLREVGLFTSTGTLFAVGNLPDTYKPESTEGSFSDTVVRMVFEITNADVVNLFVDPNVTVATQDWVRNNLGAKDFLPGGTTNQVLTKRTNIDGDVEWRDPTEVNISVDCKQEIQTAAAGQDIFILATMSTTGVAVYVEGVRDFDFITLDNIRVKTTRTFPAGTRLMFVQNDPAAPYHNRLQRPGSYFFAQI